MIAKRNPADRRLSGLLRAMLLALVLVGCGGSPAPMPTPVPPEPTAEPSATTVPEVPTATAMPTLAPTDPPAMATPLPTAAPTLTIAPMATTLPTLEPTQDWLVRSLKVGPGRTYVLLHSTAPEASGEPGQHLLYSDDDGRTWAPFPGGLPPAPWVDSINLDYASLDSLFAASEGGLYHWTSSEWSLLSSEAIAAVEVVYLQPEIIWVIHPTGRGGDQPLVSRSEDGGHTWTEADAGINPNGVSYLGIDPRDSHTLYAALGPWLYRGTAEGQWEVIPTAGTIPAAFTGMAIEGGNGALYLSVGGPENQIWRSDNADATDVADIQWHLHYDFGEDHAAQLLATGPSDHPAGLTLYANLAEFQTLPGGGKAIGDYLPYRSSDGGDTWERLVIPDWIE